MKLGRKLAALALAALVALPLPAFAETLTFATWQKGEKGYGDWWQAVIDEFQKQHPDVTIEWTQIPRDDYANQMTTLFASGSPPDIVHLASFEYQGFADNGWIEDLGPWIEKSQLDLTGWAGQNVCVWKGTTNCIMLLYFGYVMGVNQALLDEAGVPVPTDWDSYIDAARKLTVDKDGDGITDVYGTGVHLVAGSGYAIDILNFLLSTGGGWTDKDGKVTINTPETIAGLDRWRTIVEEGLTPMDISGGEVSQLFKEGRVAMQIQGPWINGTIQGAAPEMIDNLKIVADPLDPPLGGASNVLTLAADTPAEKKELAWQFIELATSQQFQELFTVLGASPAARPGAVTAEAFEKVPHMQLLIDATNKAAAAGVDRVPAGLEAQNNEFGKIVTEELQRMLIEKLPTEEAAANLQRRAEELQAQ